MSVRQMNRQAVLRRCGTMMIFIGVCGLIASHFGVAEAQIRIMHNDYWCNKPSMVIPHDPVPAPGPNSCKWVGNTCVSDGTCSGDFYEGVDAASCVYFPERVCYDGFTFDYLVRFGEFNCTPSTCKCVWTAFIPNQTIILSVPDCDSP